MTNQLFGRRGGSDSSHRFGKTRIAVALFATAALCLGPSVAAYADDGAEDPETVAVTTGPATVVNTASTIDDEEETTEEEVVEEEVIEEEVVEENPVIDEEPVIDETPSKDDPSENEYEQTITDEFEETDDGAFALRDSNTDQRKGFNGKDRTRPCEQPVPASTSDEIVEFANDSSFDSGEFGFDQTNKKPGEKDRKHKGKDDGDCNTPPEVPKPAISVWTGPCIPVEGGESGADISASNLKPHTKYKIVVTHHGETVFSEWVKAGKDGTAMVSVGLSSPGKYTATVSSQGDKGKSASTKFWIDECEPVVPSPTLDVTVMPCVEGDVSNALQALFRANGLLPGEEGTLEVTGPGGFAWSGSMTGSEAGTAEATVVLGPDGTYTATLSVGGSYGEGPVELYGFDESPRPVDRHYPESVTIEFSAAKDCPMKPAVGPPIERPAAVLAETGSSGQQMLLWAGAIALIVAAGLMLEPVIAKRIRGARR